MCVNYVFIYVCMLYFAFLSFLCLPLSLFLLFFSPPNSIYSHLNVLTLKGMPKINNVEYFRKIFESFVCSTAYLCIFTYRCFLPPVFFSFFSSNHNSAFSLIYNLHFQCELAIVHSQS